MEVEFARDARVERRVCVCCVLSHGILEVNLVYGIVLLVPGIHVEGAGRSSCQDCRGKRNTRAAENKATARRRASAHTTTTYGHGLRFLHSGAVTDDTCGWGLLLEPKQSYMDLHCCSVPCETPLKSLSRKRLACRTQTVPRALCISGAVHTAEMCRGGGGVARAPAREMWYQWRRPRNALRKPSRFWGQRLCCKRQQPMSGDGSQDGNYSTTSQRSAHNDNLERSTSALW